MIPSLLKETQSALSHFFDHIDSSSLENVIEECFSTKGLLLLSGIGKSGIIAEKIAATLTSTGTRALYLPPMNFLHGDIGILSENDTLLFLSKSGEAEELLNLIPFVRQKKTKTIAIVSKMPSRLASACSFALALPVQKELCSFDLVPTISSQVQLIFGDILSVALMQKRNFSKEDYALNHPLGSIGKKITVAVKDLMLVGDRLPVCLPHQKLADVLVELTHKKCGAIIITDETSSLKGIFTDGDLRRALQTHGPDVLHHPMNSLMTCSAITVDSHILAWDALKAMQKDPTKWIMVTPVIEQGKVVGILRMHDIIQAGIS